MFRGFFTDRSVLTRIDAYSSGAVRHNRDPESKPTQGCPIVASGRAPASAFGCRSPGRKVLLRLARTATPFNVRWGFIDLSVAQKFRNPLVDLWSLHRWAL